MTHRSVESFVALAARRDLESLHAEVTRLLGEFPETERPYVATSLQRALDMFLDAYKEVEGR
jgi:hypothetical protein